MGVVTLRVGLVLLLLFLVELKLAPYAGYVGRNAPTGFQLPAKLAKVGADSGDCRLYVLTLTLSAV